MNKLRIAYCALLSGAVSVLALVTVALVAGCSAESDQEFLLAALAKFCPPGEQVNTWHCDQSSAVPARRR